MWSVWLALLEFQNAKGRVSMHVDCGRMGTLGRGGMANGALSHPVIKSVECRKRFPKDLRLVEGLAWWWKGAGERGGAQ